MAEAATHPNVSVKISGLNTASTPGWTWQDWLPYVDHAVEHFGSERLMLGSDWPVSILAGDFQGVWRAQREVIAHLEHRATGRHPVPHRDPHLLAGRLMIETSQAPLPLAGMLVLDFSQFLAGPMAAMRLGDLGARVIKIERPQGGDIGRRLAFAGVVEDGDTLSFHITNRNKESYAADLKNDGRPSRPSGAGRATPT